MIVQHRKTNAQILNKIFFLCFKSVRFFSYSCSHKRKKILSVPVFNLWPARITQNFSLRQPIYILSDTDLGIPTRGWGDRVINKKNTVSNLCQSDRHFLAFSGTTRNGRHSKSK